MKKLIIILTILFAGDWAMAQNAHFTTTGTVEFEKSVNMYAYLKKRINKNNESYMQQYLDAYKKNNPQFKKYKSVLSFSKDKAMYKPVANQEFGKIYGDDPAIDQNNTIFTDLLTNTSITQKKVYEETFLVKDSVRKINWKITDETRDIAGYTCRRANALIMDSIYVVAFYSEEIPVSAGPESFTNLPGMILGVALPHENITWFATKVTDITVDPKALQPPTKGKVVTYKGLQETLQSALKDWGEYAQNIFKAMLL